LLITSGTPSALLVHVHRPVPSRLITPSADDVQRTECDGENKQSPLAVPLSLEDCSGGTTVAADWSGLRHTP
jgi:hypothetical protein